ncbi:MAG: hypothetical protein VZQ27_00485 [Candidatus Cryptobacteroides sp.]|nr:hypothetical protein [Candidatus Cryptobacteroides sp.]
MKKTIWAILTAVALFAVGCNKEYDDSALVKKVNDLEGRVSALESLNTTVSGISALVSALNEKDYVTGVIDVKDKDGNVIGYTLTFKNGSKDVTIYNGEKGATGEQGPQGEVGPTGPIPSIGVQLGEDGIYYWVVEGELVKDAEGNPIPCTQVTPTFKIEDGSWWISYDGQNWTKLGLISDTGTTVEVDNSNEDYVLLTINGTEVQIPKEKPFVLEIKYDGDLASVGVAANSTAGIEYEVKGAGESDDVTVDVLSTTAGISAKISKTDNTTGYILITTTDVVDGKIFVYADNNKGKTNIKSIKLEAGQISEIADVAQAPSAGGEMALTVTTNMAHSVVVPDGINWLHIIRKGKAGEGSYLEHFYVGEKTKAAQDYEYVITIDPNETASYRAATISVVSETTGEVLQAIDIVQKPAPGVTDLSSIDGLPDDEEVAIEGSVVLAASKKGAVVSDGKNSIYVEYEKALAVGDSISFTGVKKTNEDTEYAYIKAASVEVVKAGVEVPDQPWMYIGYSESYNITNTATTALIQKDEEGNYFFVAPLNFNVYIESPLESLNFDALVGKYATVKGYIDEVRILGIDWTTFSYICEYTMIVNSATEVKFEANSNWSVSYDGKVSGDEQYPEQITNTVSSGSDRYFLGVISETQLKNFSVEEAPEEFGAIYMADDLQYYITRYSSGYSKEEIISILTNDATASETFKEFGPGKYYAIAAGFDEDGLVTGSYAISEFEIKDPHVVAKYEDFLGTWSYESDGGLQKWDISEKVAGESYNLVVNDVVPNGGVYPTLVYDAERGSFTLDAQDLGEFEYDDETYIEQVAAVFASFGGGYYDNTDYMEGETRIFEARMNEDGSIDIIPSSDSFGPLEGFAIMTGVKGVSEREYIVGDVSLLPGILGEYEAPDEAYLAWLGDWTVTTGNASYNINIAQDVPNKSYTITGMNGFSYSWVNIPNYYDAETGELVLIGSDKYPAATGVSLGLDQSFSLCFLANVEIEGEYYRITGTYELGRGSIGADGTASFVPGTIKLSDGDYTVAYQRIYAIGESDPTAIYTLNGETLTYYPFTMAPASSEAKVSANAPANSKITVREKAGKSIQAKPALKKTKKAVRIAPKASSKTELKKSASAAAAKL